MLSEIKNESTMKKKTYLVLILVLMEYALGALWKRNSQWSAASLNPCFNGICSRRTSNFKQPTLWKVLILVLMEYALGGQKT